MRSTRDHALPEYPRPQLVRDALAQPQRRLGARLHRRRRRPAHVVRRPDRGAVLPRGAAVRGRPAAPARRVALVPPHLRLPARSAPRAVGCCCTSAPSTRPARSGSTASRSAAHRRLPALHLRRHRRARAAATDDRSRSGSATSPRPACTPAASSGCDRGGDLVHRPVGHLADRLARGGPGGVRRAAGPDAAPRATGRVEVTVVARRDAGPTARARVDGSDGAPTARRRGRGRRCPTPRSRSSEVRPWSPEDPHLYDVEVTLGEDRVTSLRRHALASGSARTSTAYPRLLLNGEPVPARRRARPGVLARRAAHRRRATRRWCTTSRR